MIFKNNKTLIIVIILGIIILVAFFVFTILLPTSTKQTTTIPYFQEDTVSNQKNASPKYIDVPHLSQNVSDSVSQKEKDKISSLLPIKIKNFETSVGKTTNINVFSLDSEPSQVIHIEIYGVNYYLSDATTDNPQAVAFAESFNQIKKNLSEKGVDLNNLQIVYGNRDYIQNTAETWIKILNLLP